MYQAKDAGILARQLEAQRVLVSVNAVAGTSDLASNVVVNNTAIAATVVTLTVGEAIEACYSVKVINRATGAVVAIAAAPSLAVAQKISVTFDGTAQTDLALEFNYAVA